MTKRIEEMTQEELIWAIEDYAQSARRSMQTRFLRRKLPSPSYSGSSTGTFFFHTYFFFIIFDQ